MNSRLFSICFETDTTLDLFNEKDTLLLDELNTFGASGALGHPIPNKDVFTISTLLNTKIQIIPNNRIADLQDYYKINFPHIKLWFFDINIIHNFDKCVCIILFINGVYGIHYVCNIDNYSIRQQKQYITDIVIPNYKLYKHTQNNDDKYEFNLLINTFDSNGNTKTSTYEITF